MTERITGKTQVCGIIGDPVEHTMSPVMHNAAFAALALDYVYVPFHVQNINLAAAVHAMRALQLRGLNVTVPHKITVIPLLDEVDQLTGQIGAVNTIVNSSGKLIGYNTDAQGFIQAMLAKGVDPSGQKVVILGGGGVARAVSYSLAQQGARLTILNRRQELEWAVELAGRLAAVFGRPVAALEMTRANLKTELVDATILVNATSVGMTPLVDETPVPADLLRPGLLVYDVVYNPAETRLLREAKRTGAPILGGLDMLVWQGAMAFEKWTGVPAPFDIMKEAAVKAMRPHVQ